MGTHRSSYGVCFVESELRLLWRDMSRRHSVPAARWLGIVVAALVSVFVAAPVATAQSTSSSGHYDSRSPRLDSPQQQASLAGRSASFTVLIAGKRQVTPDQQGTDAVLAGDPPNVGDQIVGSPSTTTTSIVPQWTTAERGRSPPVSAFL